MIFVYKWARRADDLALCRVIESDRCESGSLSIDHRTVLTALVLVIAQDLSKPTKTTYVKETSVKNNLP